MATGDYCALEDVKGWLPGDQKIDDQTGNPIAATVSDWITKFSGEINVALAGAGAVVPATETNLKAKLNITLARELAYQVMTKRNATKSKDEEALYLGWHTQYEELLAAIEKGTVLPATSGNLAWSYTQGSTYGVTSPDPSIDPKISVDTKY